MAVARIDPGLVGQLVEELGLHVVEQARERLGVLVRVADPAGEEAVPGEQVRGAVRIVVDERDGARGVADQMAGGQRDLPHPDRAVVVDEHVGRDRDAFGVVPTGVGTRTGGRHHLGQSLPVVAVPMGGDDGRDGVVTDQPQQGSGLVGRVDQELLAGGPAAQ